MCDGHDQAIKFSFGALQLDAKIMLKSLWLCSIFEYNKEMEKVSAKLELMQFIFNSNSHILVYFCLLYTFRETHRA